MALILSIETSTHSFSCAIHANGELLNAQKSVSDQTTASMLAVMIDKMFNEVGVKKNELDAVVVASGPGSYTGLRIGVATAKGICYALNIPLISEGTLKLLAYQIKTSIAINGEFLLCPMLDARRMEVYSALFDQNLNVVGQTEAKVINDKSFQDELDQTTVLFFGDGATKCRDIISHPNAKFIPGVVPSAQSLGELCYKKFSIGEFEDVEHFEPFYLKDFIVKKPNSTI